mgnify:CR=1 FL=1
MSMKTLEDWCIDVCETSCIEQEIDAAINTATYEECALLCEEYRDLNLQRFDFSKPSTYANALKEYAYAILTHLATEHTS